MQLFSIGLLTALFTVSLPTSLPAAAAPTLYPQLIATVYPTGSTLPKEASRPAPLFDFVTPSEVSGGDKILSAARGGHGAVWVVTPKGAFHRVGKRYVPLEPPRLLKPHQPVINPDTFVNCVAAGSDGHIWAGTTAGVYATDGDNWWYAIDRRHGMPVEDVKCLLVAANGDVWAGTEQGAWRMRAGNFRYFAGRRWLADNHVAAIWEDSGARIWLQTASGFSCIEEKKITLGVKARYFNELTQKWNNRRGYINERALKSPGQLSGSVFDVSDNDGLWNAIYVGAMTFRYAATHDDEAKQQAWQALGAMLELERLTGIAGYPARAVITDAELAQGVTGFSATETVRVPGETDPIWFRSNVDKSIWCKGDTSSDELDGHYFAWLVYFDLAADAAQKAKIAGVCRRVTDRIISGGYNLLGHTGRPTRWGIYSPKYLNDDPAWWDQRPLNSLSLLAYLKAAAHITGDARYERRYEALIRENHYLLNVLEYRKGIYAEWQNINHSDDEMGYMMFYIMLALEKDPGRRALVLEAFRHTFEENGIDLTLKPEHSPLYNYMYGGLTGRACAADEAAETLQDWPWDRVQWSMTNSARADVTFRQGMGLKSVAELNRALPISERALHRWNGNPFQPDGGSDGRTYDDGAAWLLGYWTGVYFGYLPVER